MNETNPNLIFIKLGGSLITDKTIPRKADLARIRALAAEIKHIHQSRPNLRMILGHGSGSFGHMEAHKYGTVQGVRSPEEWQGFQKVWSAAHELNQIVLSELLDAGLPVVNFPPSATVTLANHSVTVWNLEPMQACLDHGLILWFLVMWSLTVSLGGPFFPQKSSSAIWRFISSLPRC